MANEAAAGYSLEPFIPGEQWKPVRGHPGYEASSLGRVRSVPRTLRDGRQAGGVVLKPQPDKDGYQRVRLGGKLVAVHAAVALAFHGKPEVRHLNGDQADNKPGNLAWGSHLENERDKKRAERNSGRGPSRPFTDETPPGTPAPLVVPR